MDNEISTLYRKRVKIFCDTSIIKSENGVIVRNGKRSFSIQGESSYHLMLWLSKNLNGKVMVKNFIPSEKNKSKKILEVINFLINNNFARVLNERLNDKYVKLSEKQEKTYFFLERYVEDPLKSLNNFISKNAICVGGGVNLISLVSCLLEHGILKFDVICFKKDFETINRIFKKFLNFNPNISYQLKELTSENISKIKTNKNCFLTLSLDDFSEFSDEIKNILNRKKISAIVYSDESKIYVFNNLTAKLKNIFQHGFIKKELHRPVRCLSPSAAAVASSYIGLIFLLAASSRPVQLSLTSIAIDQETLQIEDYEQS